jgi:NAD(P)H-hydrate repair Nnr-like enzyme with NAD(P)H-hydrate dehydratase domain
LVRLLGARDYPDATTATSMAASRNGDDKVRLAPIAIELEEAK